jgi:hypothetical protein
MKQRFLNQKLGKRMSRKAALQRARLPARKGSGSPPRAPSRPG